MFLNRIQRYILMQCIMGLLLVMTVFVVTILLVDVVEQLRTVGGDIELPPLIAVQLSLMKLPGLIEQTLPFGILVAAMMAYSRLNVKTASCQDFTPTGRVVAFQADYNRDSDTHLLDRTDNALGDQIASDDAAEKETSEPRHQRSQTLDSRRRGLGGRKVDRFCHQRDHRRTAQPLVVSCGENSPRSRCSKGMGTELHRCICLPEASQTKVDAGVVGGQAHADSPGDI